MPPAPLTRRPSGNASSGPALIQKETTKRGLKRRASREAINPRGRKRVRRNEPGALPLTEHSRQLQVVSVGNSWVSPRLFVWGCGDDGSFGLGPDHLEEIPRPQLHPWQGVTSIAAGGMYTLLLDIYGQVSASPALLHSNSTLYAQVWSCGNNDNYALGRETEYAKLDWGAPRPSFDELVSKPYAIPRLKFHNISSICAGNELSAAVSVSGELFVWGAVRVSFSHLYFPYHEHIGG